MSRSRLAIIACSLLLLAGCNTGTRSRLNCICLIDYSGSLSPETLHQYVQLISRDVLSRLKENDRLVVLPIDEGAKTKAVKLVYDDFSEKKFSYYTDGYAHAKDSLDLRLRNYSGTEGRIMAVKLLHEKDQREKYTYQTDLFAALEQAAELVERDAPETFWGSVERFVTGKKKIASTNMIIIFSDMLQESSEVSFADSQGCTAEQAGILFARLRSANRIPDLHGCRVFVNGRTGKTNEQVDNIRNFWSEYFKEAGVDLMAYDYDAGPQIVSYLDQR